MNTNHTNLLVTVEAELADDLAQTCAFLPRYHSELIPVSFFLVIAGTGSAFHPRLNAFPPTIVEGDAGRYEITMTALTDLRSTMRTGLAFEIEDYAAIRDWALSRDRGRRTERQGDPRYRRQLRHPQTPEGQGIAGSALAVELPLHADIVLLAERGRGVFRKTHQMAPQTQRVRLGR